MLKHIVLAAFLTAWRGGCVCAAATGGESARIRATIDSKMADAKMAPSATADTRKLIGRNIKNAEGETIGEIKSIYINKDGKVDSVMVGVGGFLGVGDREVRIAWSDLRITDNGEKVTVNMTKDELKAKPEYKYKERDVARPGLHRHRPVDGAAERHRAFGRRGTAGKRPARPDDQAAGRPRDRQAG